MDKESLAALGPRKPLSEIIPGWNEMTHLQHACIESIAAIEWWRGYHAGVVTNASMKSMDALLEAITRHP